MVIVLIGAAGAGKTTVGRALADALGWRFFDADDLHAADSVAKMRRGMPLTDEERWPWLGRVRDVVAAAVRSGDGMVLACSALRESYRRFLRDGLDGVQFVFLRASADLLRARIEHRVDHFAPASLVDSQLATLEPPLDALVLDASRPVPSLVDAIRDALEPDR